MEVSEGICLLPSRLVGILNDGERGLFLEPTICTSLVAMNPEVLSVLLVSFTLEASC